MSQGSQQNLGVRMKTVYKTEELHLIEIRRPCLEIANDSQVRNATWSQSRKLLRCPGRVSIYAKESEETTIFLAWLLKSSD